MDSHARYGNGHTKRLAPQPPHQHHHPPPPRHASLEGGISEDLHAWSLFRQNLNANFSESALNINGQAATGQQPQSSSPDLASGHHPSGQNKSSANGHFQMRESTVNNILSHPKYGAQLKNQDAFTYLRFGLPRVKVTSNSGPAHRAPPEPALVDHQPIRRNFHKVQDARDAGHTHQQSRPQSQLNEELKRRFWSSETNLRPTIETSPRVTSSDFDSSGQYSDSSGKEMLPPRGVAAGRVGNGRGPSPVTRVQPQRTTGHHHQQQQSSRPMKPSYSINDLRYKPRPGADRSFDQHGDFGPSSGGSSDEQRVSPHFDHHNQQQGHLFDEDIRLDEIMTGPGEGQTAGGPPHRGPNSSLPPPLAKHPHLVVKDLLYEVDKSPVWRRLCGFSRQKLRVLEDINFDVRGGELMAVMATNALEGTALLDVLSNRYDHRNGRIRAELYLNGVTVTPRSLAKVAAYVQSQTTFCPDMTARQALLFAGLLMGPAARGNSDMKRRTTTILEELNLGEVRHTKVDELTDSERRRLHIAIHLLLDTEILLLDQPLQGLDIFDAFFLVEYLRQWAAVGCRTVLMTISPPTFEVFTMLHRVLLLSAGRSLFVGPRRDLLKYFAALDFPCPPFKNPSDYYLDLVTLDDLSQEALIESSQRVENLAELHARRPLVELFSSMPGPPAVVPPPFRRANLAMQFLALWIRALIFGFPYNVVALFNRFLVAITLSLLIGGIYWQVRSGREQEYVWDRIGFVTTMLSFGLIPLMLAELWNAYREKQYILSEIEQNFYSLPAYLLAKTLYSIPQSLLIGLAYALPACSLAGLHHHSGPNSLPYYLLVMLSYYFTLRSLTIALVWSCSRRSTATVLFTGLFSIFLLGSGALLQLRDLAFTHRWLRAVSPLRWLHEALIGWEFEPNAISTAGSLDGSTLPVGFLCSRNPVIQQPNAILVRADCGFQSRANVLKWFEYQGGTPPVTDLRPWWHALIALLILYLTSFLLGSIIFCLKVYYFRSDASTRRRSTRP